MQRREFLGHTTAAALGFGILRTATACGPGEMGNLRFATLQTRYFKRCLELNPVTSTYLGGDGFDTALAEVNGRLRDYSPSALADEVAFYRDIATELDEFPAGDLSAKEHIDKAVIGAQIGFLIRQLDSRRYQQRCVDTYVEEPFRGVDWQIQQMQDAGNGLLGTEAEWALVIARVGAIPAYLETARANLSAGVAAGNQSDRRVVERGGIPGASANAAYFRTTLQDTATRLLGDRPLAGRMTTDLRAAGSAAAAAWEGFASFLGATYDVSERVDRFAAGEEEYAWRVANCLRDPRTPAELFDHGAREVRTYEDAIYQVAEEVARDAQLGLRFDTPAARRTSVRAVMNHLSRESPRDDDALFAWYREAGERAVAYGRAHDLFDIPADYRLDVIPTPPVLRAGIDAAYYPAPPLKPAGVGRFYLTPTGNDPAALRLNNRASVADTAVHEGFPGHDWHFKFMTAHAREISPVRWFTAGGVEDSFSMWQDSMATEGWGLYSEELMAEPLPERPHGFYSAGEHLYELQGQLLRAVRVRVDVGIHTGRMTFDQAVDYFTEHVDFYPGARAMAGRDTTARAITESATRAIYRYSKWPTQAITYNLGKNAIVELREAARARQGAAFDAKAFHEQFMAMGTIPAGYFRDAFLSG